MASIGIDLGTTYSSVSIISDGSPVTIPNELGNDSTPSYVSYREDGTVVVGQKAKYEMVENMHNTIYDSKRLIGRSYNEEDIIRDRASWPFEVVKGEEGRPMIRAKKGDMVKDVYPEEVSSEILKHLISLAESRLGKKVESAVITVPAHFNEGQRQSTKRAAELSGLKTFSLLPEPTAAAIAAGLLEDEECNVLVFDLGGGTFDVSILNISPGFYEVKAIRGDQHLGGQDFDNELVLFVAQRFNEKNHCNILSDPRAAILLKQECERQKEFLSTAKKVTIRIDSIYNGLSLNEVVTVDDFERINKHHFDKLVPTIRQALADAHFTKDDISKLFLVGGSSRIPKIRAILREEFPALEPYSSVNPDLAVSYGAAIRAQDPETFVDTPGGIILCTVPAHSRGIEIEGRKLKIILNKEDLIPNKCTETFQTTYDNQEAVNILVFEGENTEDSEANHFLGQFMIKNLPKKPKGEVKIDVTFYVDENDFLEVTACPVGSEELTEVVRISNILVPGEPQRSMILEEKTTAVDLVFCIDATRSMDDWLRAAVDRCQSILNRAQAENPDVRFRFGAIFYRDPIDFIYDETLFFPLTDDIGSLRAQMQRNNVARGGGDDPEDWVGAYEIIVNEVKWAAGASRAVIHITDAPAHGTIWGGDEKHNDQGPLLLPLIRSCAQKNIFLQGVLVGTGAKPSFDKAASIYRNEGKENKIKITSFDESSFEPSDFFETVAHEVLLSVTTATKPGHK